jgi:protein-tyrosine kinase
MDSATEDELSKMVERVFLSSAKVHTVVFSGIERGVGCSWVLACAADILSRRVGGSVCVVEASGATPNVSEYLGNGNQKIGLASGVTGAKRLSDTLWTTTLGTPTSTSTGDVPVTSTARDHFLELRQQFEYVLVDAPPLRTGSDAITLARNADGLVLILEGSVTHRETARKAVQDVTAANAKLLGAVLNKRKFPIPAGIYSKL